MASFGIASYILYSLLKWAHLSAECSHFTSVIDIDTHFYRPHNATSFDALTMEGV